ncbi:MAG: capsular biosynthesis protein [Acidobacteria bacterium]|nr:capsular biosynthesis protein [Acidobacteriota bacterium]
MRKKRSLERLLASYIILMICAVVAAPQSAKPDTQDCTEVRAQAARLESRIKDWPALARYRQANAQVPAQAKNEERVVFMGDSITDWWDNEGNGGFFPGKPYINRGIGGQNTGQMLIRFRPDVIALKPKVVVILGGTNDIADKPEMTALEPIKANLISMIELSRANNIRVVLASLLPVSDYGRVRDRDDPPIAQTVRRRPEQIKALNEWIRTYAAENGLTYLDYYSAMVDEKGFLQATFSNDGLHPVGKGYAVMVPLAEQAIAKALKRKR